MQALDRNFVKTYEYSVTKRPFQYTTTVRHKGTVIAFAMDDRQHIYYSVLNLDRTTDPTQSKGDSQPNSQRDLDYWDIEPQELLFPTELAQVGYRAVTPHAVQLYRKSGRPVQPDEILDSAEIDWFLSTTARLTADAPIQVLSDEKYIYVFRQAIAADHPRKILSENNGVAVVDLTLLLDRFVYVDGKLTRKREVRYQRSRNKDLPASRKDALGYEDLEKKPFYEPTQELSFIRHLTSGQFSVVLIPTALPDVQRWQIFAHNSKSQRMDSFNIERSSDGLFNTRGTRYYTSSDPERQKDVFQRSPIDPATKEILVPIVSQSDYAESALAFDGQARSIQIPAREFLNFGSQDFTIELWLQVHPSTGAFLESTLFEQKGENSIPISIRYLQSGEAAGQIRIDRSHGAIKLELLSIAKINDGQFHHLAVVRTTDKEQQAKLIIFIDGKESSSVIDNTQTLPGKVPIFVASRDGNGDFFTGTIDELRVWNRGRSVAEIQEDRHHRLIGNEPGLVGYWRFDEGSGATAHDQTDFVNHAQLLKPEWITSEAPVGDHPGVRRSSFAIRDRAFTAGCSALLYYQQEQAETGYTSNEKKPMKRSARVMLAMTTAPTATTAPTTGNADSHNYIAVMDFAVSREGALAQVPDLVNLKPLEGMKKGTGSLNDLLDAIAKLEETIRSQQADIIQIEAELSELEKTKDPKFALALKTGAYFKYQQKNQGISEFPVTSGTRTIYHHSCIAYQLVTLEPWAILSLTGQPPFKSITYTGPLPDSARPNETKWVNPKNAIDGLTLTLDINEDYYSNSKEVEKINAAIAAKTEELLKLEISLNIAQVKLRDAREALTETVSLPMEFLHVDPTGLTTLGSLLKFAWTPDAPVLFESVDGRLSLYFRGEADQFFAAYYDVIAGRSSFYLSTVNSTQQSDDGTILFTAHTSGAVMEKTEITIAPSHSPANAKTCQVTIANSNLDVREVWNQVPRDPQTFAAVLNGAAQPVYVGRLLNPYAGNVSQIDLDRRRGQLTAGSVLLVGDAQTKATIVKAEPMFEGTIGFKGQALKFDGEKDYVEIPNAQTLGLTNNSFTIEAWVSINDFQGKDNDRPILGTDDPNQRLENKALQAIVRDARPRMGFYENDTPGDINIVLKPNVWYHLTWRYDKAKQEQAIFINGNLNKALLERKPFSGTGRLAIGRWNGDRYFKGFIGEVRIWNEARSGADIRADMSRPLSDRSPKLTACWRFEYVPVEEDGDPNNAPLKLIAKDYATDNPTLQHNGTVMGNPQLTEVRDHRRVQIQPIDLKVKANESVYLLPYDYAVHAQTQPARIGWSLNHGSRLVVVDSQNAGENVAGSAQPATSNKSGLNCRWFADSQGNALNFSVVSPAVTPANKARDFVSGLLFDSRDDRIEYPMDNAIDFFESLTSKGITIEAHFCVSDPDFEQVVLATENDDLRVWVIADRLHLKIADQFFRDTRTLSANTWYSIAWTAIVENGSTLRVNSFINGNRAPQEPVRSSNRPDLSPSKVLIGTRIEVENNESFFSNSFRGRIGEVRLWNGIRTDEEIKRYVGRRIPGRKAGLAAYWHFQDGEAQDYSGRGNHGTLYGTPTRTSVPFRDSKAEDFAVDGDCTLETWIMPTAVREKTVSVVRQTSDNSKYHLTLTPSDSPSALDFDGRDDRIEFPIDTGTIGFSQSFTSKGITIEAHIYVSDPTLADQVILATQIGDLRLLIFNNQLSLYLAGDTYLDTRPLSANTWYWVACTAILENGSAVRVNTFINGERDRQEQVVRYAPNLSPSPLQIGTWRNNYFKGRIGEVRLWNGIRTDEEIKRYVGRHLPGLEAGLAAYWHFQDGKARDYSGRENHGTLHGNPTLANVPLAASYQISVAIGDQGQKTKNVLLCHTWNHLAAVFNQSYGLRFDGQESRIECGTERTLDITDDLTLELYLKPEVLDGRRGLLHKGKQGEGLPYALFLDGNQLRFAYEDESGKYIELKPVNYYTFAENTFYRIALTREKRTEIEPALKKDENGKKEEFDPDRHKYVTKYDIRYYVQKGDELTEIGYFTQSEAARSSALSCQIGGAIADRGFQGTIAEVRIWNTARTEKELFRAFPATDKGLVSWWKFEENQGNLAYDSKSTNHGTRIGATWVKSPDPQGSQLTLYVNGEPELTTPDTPSAINSQFAIGTLKQGDSYTQTFQGQLDEIRIWKTARTKEQIQDNLFRRLMSDFEQLIAYYNCDAKTMLEDQSGRSLHLLLPDNLEDAFDISTAPISNETAKVRSALAGVKTDFHDVIGSAPGIQEYGDKQYDSDGNLIGVMKRCYSYIQAGKWQLISGFKVGDLELEWIGQAQYEPQLVGFIEGAPPVPSENLTVRDVNQGEIYDEVSAIELIEADRTLYTYSASKEAGLDFSLQVKAGVGLKSETQAGVGVATTVEETAVLVGMKHGIEISQGWFNEQQAGVARGTNRLSRMNMMGSWEDPDAIEYTAIGRRYVPKNVGFALVKSKTADIFALRLKHRDPRKRVTVALTMQANPDIPEDWNIITFPMNPRYTKQGTLDGLIGLSPDKDYPFANKSSNDDRSYYKPIEAYALKNRIEKEQQQLATDYRDYSIEAVKGMQEIDKRRKSLPSATQMNLFNTYVWTAEGGFFAETQNSMSMKQEVIGSNFSLATMSGAFVQSGAALTKAAFMFELEVLLGGHLNLTTQRAQESETAFGVNVTLAVERDITLKYQYGSDDKLVTRYDADGNPMKCPGKVDGYRFMTFYLQPDKEHFQDFSNKVIDRIWLEQSSDANAAALRQAIDRENGTPWRVLHRVTYVSRVLPELAAEGSVEERLRAANIESNWELIQQLDPYVKAKTGSYGELKEAVQKTITDRYPELIPAMKMIVEYICLYYQLFPSI